MSEAAGNNTAMSDAGSVFADGFWRNNAAFVQLLGICPLLAITTTLVNGLALGIATTLVLIATNSVVSLVRGALVPSIRILIFVLIIASLVTTVDMLTNAFFHDLYRVLGLFIPLIITNCTILAQAESVASRHRIDRAAWSGLATGLGFAAALIMLGGLREIVGSGTLFSGMEFLLGEAVTGRVPGPALRRHAGSDPAARSVLRAGGADRRTQLSCGQEKDRSFPARRSGGPAVTSTAAP